MEILLILLAIAWIIIGVLMFIFTDASKEVLRNLLKQKNIKTFSILPIAIGIALLAGASLVSVPWIAVILGVLGVLKGVFFIFGPEKNKKALIDWWLSASNNVYKSWGIVAFLMGILLLLIL